MTATSQTYDRQCGWKCLKSTECTQNVRGPGGSQLWWLHSPHGAYSRVVSMLSPCVLENCFSAGWKLPLSLGPSQERMWHPLGTSQSLSLKPEAFSSGVGTGSPSQPRAQARTRQLVRVEEAGGRLMSAPSCTPLRPFPSLP